MPCLASFMNTGFLCGRDFAPVSAAPAQQANNGTAIADAQPAGDGRQYLHEIVANGRNGLDVDKYDYLSRDAYCCGVPMAAELNRLKTFSKVTAQLCRLQSSILLL